MTSRRPPNRAERAVELRDLVHACLRTFGVLAGDRTPCGRPLSIAHAHALLVLRQHGDRELTQQELGRALCIDKSNVARLCARMEKLGHVTQRRSELDGRSRRIGLTARGQRLAGEIDGSSRERFATLLEAIAPEARDSVVGALRQLQAAFRVVHAERQKLNHASFDPSVGNGNHERAPHLEDSAKCRDHAQGRDPSRSNGR